MKGHCAMQFYGSATVGEKGQIVIPVEARKVMHLNSGEKLLAFSLDNETIMFAKPSKLAELTTAMSKKLESLQNIMKENQ